MTAVTYIPSPFGIFEIKGSELGVRSVSLVMVTGEEPTDFPDEVRRAKDQLTAYFEGNLQRFDLKLDWSGTPDFYQKVWRQVCKIPFGKTSSYGTIARTLGNKNSMRAVGQANRQNPIAIIVPCHRVIAKSGNLQGYFYGLDMKRKLLEFENPGQFGTQSSLF